jgi:MerR family transcriptional regulator/heat shock protein HspR
MISVVAGMLDIHPQTLRLYEREGFVRPSRTEGNTRLYSDDDVEEIRRILHMTRELGVNLAGVEVILEMRRKLEEMRKENERLTEYIHREVRREVRLMESRGALVPLASRSKGPGGPHDPGGEDHG